MATIRIGPDENFFADAFLRLSPFANLKWVDGRKFSLYANFVLGSQSSLGGSKHCGETIRVRLTKISFKKKFIYFEGLVKLEGEWFPVWGQHSKDGSSSGKIFLV